MNIGAYAVERNYSHYVAYAAKTIFAVVGTATKGPIGVATVCTSAQDLVNKFGALKTNYFGLYAGQYFLSQSSKLYFVRAACEIPDDIMSQKASLTVDSADKLPMEEGIAKGPYGYVAGTVNSWYKSVDGVWKAITPAVESSTVIKGVSPADDTVEDALTISSLEKGTYADGYTITVAEGIPITSIDASMTKTFTLTVKSSSGNVLEVLKNLTIDDLTTSYISSYIKVIAKNNTAYELTPGTYTLSGGNDGSSDITAADYINAASALSADTVDMNLFAVPGISDASVITAMLAIAETRGDCMYLVDPPKGLTREGVAQWHNGGGDYEHAAFNSSYGALYYDWVNIYDSINKVKVEVPPSVVVAASYAYSDRTSELWYAPAGYTRGLVRGALDSVTKLNRADTEFLYSEDNNINSIYEDPQVGLVLWGQKTLSRTDDALNRVNVRRLLNYLKRVVTAACNYLTFEPNDRVTWNSFEMKVLPILKGIHDKRGIYEYRIVRGETIVTDEDIDNYKMPCMIMIRPTKAAEEIPIYFAITSTGADFNSVLESNGVVGE